MRFKQLSALNNRVVVAFVLILIGIVTLSSATYVNAQGTDGYDWMQLTPINKPDYGTAMAYDSHRQRIVVFGSSAPTWEAATWEFDGTNWTKINTANTPSRRSRPEMVYDSNRKRIVLFGGQGGDPYSDFDDTWEYDGTNWTQVNTANKPSGRSNHLMIYDSNRKVVVMCCGGALDNEPYYKNDTWEYDGTNWTRVYTANAPSSRAGLSGIFDANRGRTVLFGGFYGGIRWYNDTWEYDGTNWYYISSYGPSKRAFASMFYNAADKKVYLFGGAFHTTTYRKYNINLPNSLNNSLQSAYSPNNIEDVQDFQYLNDTWAYDGASSNWKQINTLHSPSPRITRVSFTTDRAILFGGNGTSLVDDTWVFYMRPKLVINHMEGKPGSWFTLTGSDYPVNSTATIVVNGHAVGTVPVGDDGTFVIELNTDVADIGAYFVTIIQETSRTLATNRGLAFESIRATAQFTLDDDSPNTWPQEGTGTSFNVPASIAFTEFIYLPLIQR